MTKSRNIYQLMDLTKRVILEEMLKSGVSYRQITRRTGISRRSIGREMQRCVGEYNATEAHMHAEDIVQQKKESIAKRNKKMREDVENLKIRVDYLERVIRVNLGSTSFQNLSLKNHIQNSEYSL